MLPEIPDGDCYRILGLPFDAPNDQIKIAYKKLALQFHPDRHMDGKEMATEKFVEVSNAYQTILRERRSRNEDYRNISTPPSSESILPPYSPRLQRQQYHNYSSSSSGSSYRPNTSGDSYSSFCVKDILPDSPAFIHILPTSPVTPPSDPRSQAKSPTKYPPTPFPRIQTLPRSPATNYYPEPQATYPPPPMYRTEHSRSVPQDYSVYPNHPPEHPVAQLNHKYNDSTFPYPLPAKQDVSHNMPSQWVYRLHLTLEELFTGQPCHFQLSRSLRSGRLAQATIEFRIPPGCHHGTRFVCGGIGHERADGSVQDVVFVIEEERHRRFTRVEDDLLLVLRVPWMELLRSGGKLCVEGLDGASHTFHINYAKRLALKGIRTITGAGMPISYGERVVGRGDLIVCWEIIHPPISRWGAVKRAFHIRR